MMADPAPGPAACEEEEDAAASQQLDPSASASAAELVLEQAGQLFAVCDREAKGFITRRDMQRLRDQLPLSADHLEAVFESLDLDHNGYLTRDEFTGGFGKFLGMAAADVATEAEDSLYNGETGDLNRHNRQSPSSSSSAVAASSTYDTSMTNTAESRRRRLVATTAARRGAGAEAGDEWVQAATKTTGEDNDYYPPAAAASSHSEFVGGDDGGWAGGGGEGDGGGGRLHQTMSSGAAPVHASGSLTGSPPRGSRRQQTPSPPQQQASIDMERFDALVEEMVASGLVTDRSLFSGLLGQLASLSSPDQSIGSGGGGGAGPHIGGGTLPASASSPDQLVAALETALGELAAGARRQRGEVRAVESVLRQRSLSHEQQVGRLYEEMEAQLRAERDRFQEEERARERQIRAETEREAEEKDRLLAELGARYAALQRRLGEADGEASTARAAEQRLTDERRQLEEALEAAHWELQESRQQLTALRQQSKAERRDRALASLQISEGIALERESLVKQLGILRTMNRRLRDDQDELHQLKEEGALQHQSQNEPGSPQEEDEVMVPAALGGDVETFASLGETVSSPVPGRSRGDVVDHGGSQQAKASSASSGGSDMPPRLLQSHRSAERAAADRTTAHQEERNLQHDPPRRLLSGEGDLFHRTDTATTDDDIESDIVESDFYDEENCGSSAEDGSLAATAAVRPLSLDLQLAAGSTGGRRLGPVGRSGSTSSSDEDHSTPVQGEVPGGGSIPRERLGPEEATLPPPERIFKVVFVGDSGVGKSSFIHRFCHGQFRPAFQATIGVDFQVRQLTLDQAPLAAKEEQEREDVEQTAGGKPVLASVSSPGVRRRRRRRVVALQLWDTAGQERFRSITKQYFRRADGIVVMYDVTSETSFLNVRRWVDSAKESCEESQTVFMLLGNKAEQCDEAAQSVKAKDGQRLADQLSCSCGRADRDEAATAAVAPTSNAWWARRRTKGGPGAGSSRSAVTVITTSAAAVPSCSCRRWSVLHELCSAQTGHNVNEAITDLATLLREQEDEQIQKSIQLGKQHNDSYTSGGQTESKCGCNT